MVRNSRALSSAGERCLHTAEATGSIPVAPTGRGRRPKAASAIRNSQFAIGRRQARQHQRSPAVAGTITTVPNSAGLAYADSRHHFWAWRETLCGAPGLSSQRRVVGLRQILFLHARIASTWFARLPRRSRIRVV